MALQMHHQCLDGRILWRRFTINPQRSAKKQQERVRKVITPKIANTECCCQSGLLIFVYRLLILNKTKVKPYLMTLRVIGILSQDNGGLHLDSFEIKILFFCIAIPVQQLESMTS